MDTCSKREHADEMPQNGAFYLDLDQGCSLSKIQSTHLRNRLNACEKEIYTNSVDPDESQNTVSHQGLRCLPKISTLFIMVDLKKNVYM